MAEISRYLDDEYGLGELDGLDALPCARSFFEDDLFAHGEELDFGAPGSDGCFAAAADGPAELEDEEEPQAEPEGMDMEMEMADAAPHPPPPLSPPPLLIPGAPPLPPAPVSGAAAPRAFDSDVPGHRQQQHLQEQHRAAPQHTAATLSPPAASPKRNKHWRSFLDPNCPLQRRVKVTITASKKMRPCPAPGPADPCHGPPAADALWGAGSPRRGSGAFQPPSKKPRRAAVRPQSTLYFTPEFGAPRPAGFHLDMRGPRRRPTVPTTAAAVDTVDAAQEMEQPTTTCARSARDVQPSAGPAPSNELATMTPRSGRRVRKPGPNKLSTSTSRSRATPSNALARSTSPRDCQGSVVFSSTGPHSGIVKLDATLLCDLDKAMAFPPHVPDPPLRISGPATPPTSCQSKSTTAPRQSSALALSSPTNLAVKKTRPAKITRTTIASVRKRMSLLAADEVSHAAAKAAAATAVHQEAAQRPATGSIPNVAVIPIRRSDPTACLSTDMPEDPVAVFSVVSAALRARMAGLFRNGCPQAESKTGATPGLTTMLVGAAHSDGDASTLPAAQPAVDAVNAAARAYRSQLQGDSSGARDVLVAVNPKTGDAQMFSVHDREPENDSRRPLLDEVHGGEGESADMNSGERECALEMYLNA